MELSWICIARYCSFCHSCLPTQKKTLISLNWSADHSIYRIPAGPGVAETVTGLSPLRPKVTPMPVILGFVVDKLALWQSCLPVLQFSLVVISPMLHTHSFICHWCDINLGIYTVVKLQSMKNRYSSDTSKSPKWVQSLVRKYLVWCHSSSTLHYTVVDGMLWVSLDKFCLFSVSEIILQPCSLMLSFQGNYASCSWCLRVQNGVCQILHKIWKTRAISYKIIEVPFEKGP